MTRLRPVFLATLFLFASFPPAQADAINFLIDGNANDDDANPLDIFLLLFVGASAVAGSPTSSAAEYFLQPEDPEAANFGKVEQAQFTPGGTPGVVGSSFATLAAPVAANPFGSILIDIQDDITLENGTFIGDAVSFSFFDGTVMVDGTLIQQLSIKLLDNTGTLIGGTGLDQLVGLDLANTTSATYNILTFGFITNGTVNSYSATVVPIPATVWLLGSAVGLLGWRKIRSA